jgi:type I restriction enzyme M protein
MVEIIDPQKHESILDPACGTAGFLISSYKHILKHNSSTYKPQEDKKIFEEKDVSLSELTINGKKYNGDLLTPEQRNLLSQNIKGYDISPDMVRLSLVNMYLHGLQNPLISEYDTLTSEDKWNEFSDVILANPPFMSPKGGIRPHKRFSVQSNRSEVLFVNYMMEHLTPTGRCAVIVPEGIIFQSGTAYKSLRKMLVENYLVGVISLPAGVFQPYSGVKTSILWMDKTLAKKTEKILFVKIENDGFDLGAQRRPIKLNDLPQADVAIKSYKALLQSDKNFHCENISNISIVEKSRIGENGEYNLSGERYKASKILSNKYESVRLVDICKVINGRAYRQDELLDNGKYPVLRVGNFFSNKGSIT